MRKDGLYYFIFLKEIIYRASSYRNCVLFSRSLSLKDAVFIFSPVNNNWYLYFKKKTSIPSTSFLHIP